MYGDVKYSPIRVGIVNRGEWMCSEVVFSDHFRFRPIVSSSPC